MIWCFYITTDFTDYYGFVTDIFRIAPDLYRWPSAAK